MTPCPSDDDLRRLGDDDLDPALFAEWERHIEECPRCEDRLKFIAWECSVPENSLPPEIPGYTIERELGRGAMGVVYLARRADSNRHVALKILSGGNSQIHRPRDRRRWLREAQAASSVKHPNIVLLYDFGEADGCLYLILEHVPGGTLRQRLSGPLPARIAASILEAIARAVAHIHDRGLLHLDQKPSNILLDCPKDAPWDEVIPKVADFGVSLSGSGDSGCVSETTLAGPRGTPSYMAPEQTIGDLSKIGKPADIYALGAILYELLTGRPPFQAASSSETMEQVRNVDPVPPRRLNPKIPRDLETIALKCLEKNPSRRYPSAEAVADDLRRYLDGRPIRARPVSWAEHGWRYIQRQPKVAGSFAAFVTLLLISVVGLLFLYKRAESQRSVAEQNLRIAAEVITNIDRLVVSSTNWSRRAEREKVEGVITLLRGQIANVRQVSGSKPNLLVQSVLNNARLSMILVEYDMQTIARQLARENIDIMRECGKQNPTNEDIYWHLVELLASAGHIERAVGQGNKSLGYLDEASDLLLNRASNHPSRLRLASMLSDEYLQLGKNLADNAYPEESKHARNGQLKLLALLESELSERPDRVFLKACAFADNDEWDEACNLIHTLVAAKDTVQSGQKWIQIDPVTLQDAVRHALMEWFRREARHWRIAFEGQDVEPEALDFEAIRILDLIARLAESQRLEDPLISDALDGIRFELASRAGEERKAGYFDQADRTASLLMAFAQRLTQRFPGNARSYSMLSEAYMQQSKNAWKRDDMNGVKRGLEHSIRALERGLTFEPGHGEMRKNLEDHKTRITALPKS